MADKYSLFCMSGPGGEPSANPGEDPPGFEEEFIINER